MSTNPRPQYVSAELVLCPACHGIPIDHPAVRGEYRHHTFVDDTDPTAPVVHRCWVCNATAHVADRDSWDKRKGNISRMYIVNETAKRTRKDPSLFQPCDVCGGSGAVPAPTEDDR